MIKKYIHTPEKPMIEAAYFNGSDFTDIEELTKGKKYTYLKGRIEYEDYRIPYVFDECWLVRITYINNVIWTVADDEEFGLNYTPLVQE